MARLFHKDGTQPKNGEIFVFGSNLAGIHGAGAALAAQNKFGAVYGIGWGPVGQSYAIPTKDYNIDTLPIEIIKVFVDAFNKHTQFHPEQHFFVTRVGCVLAGLTNEQMAPLFSDAINCSFAEEWKPFLK